MPTFWNLANKEELSKGTEKKQRARIKINEVLWKPKEESLQKEKSNQLYQRQF